MPIANFVHLHNHTEYSLLDGACRVSDLVDTASKMGMPALAITDHGNMFGAVEFYLEANSKGIKPIIGCEVYVSPSSRLNRDPKESPNHLVLLAKNAIGYKNLVQIVSRGYLEGFYYRARVDKDVLQEHHEGLIALTACIKGQVPWLLIGGQVEHAKQAAGDLLDIFGKGNLYIELQYHQLENEKLAIPQLIKLSKEFDIPLVATNDCHYISKSDSEAHDALLAIQTGKTIDDPGKLTFGSNDFYFRSPEEMEALFSQYDGAIHNSLEIAEKCELKLSSEYIIPDIPLPAGLNPDSYIKRLCDEGLSARYPNTNQEITDRLKYEIDLIQKTGFATFFLIARDIVQFAKSRGIRVGPGRGSCAGSIVSYIIGISNIDPLKHGLVFERFLNPERITPPDFDIDFDADRRGEIIEYITGKYGRESVAQIITFNRMTARAVVRDVGRALGIPLPEVDRIAKLIPSTLGITLDKAIEAVPDLQSISQDQEKGSKLIRIAKALEGMARNASVHAAGVVISGGKTIEYVPVYKTSKDEIVVQYDMMMLEKVGANKFDILGLDALTMMDQLLKLIEENHHVKIDIDNLPLDDKETYDLLCSGRTLGVFQLGGQGMVDLVIKLQPRVFEDISPIVSLYRPGPIQSGMMDEYVGRKIGTIPTEYSHPVLEPILKSTYGTMVYQEQIMKIGCEMAGFTLGQTDLLRRAMGKKQVDIIEKQRGAFVEGAKSKGIPGEVAEAVFEQMIPFAGYCFNQSHSTAYALVTYQTAYLKTHYPVEFMAASMTREKANSSEVVKYIRECQDGGIQVLPPDVNESYANFTAQGRNIRFGIGAVKNVGESAVEAMVAAREEKGPFKSLFDFCERVDHRAVNRKCIESLIKCGAFDSLGGHRGQFLEALDMAMESGQSAQKDREVGQVSLFDFTGVSSAKTQKLPDVPKLSDIETLAMEKEMLGFYVSGHPLVRYEDMIKEFANATTSSLHEILDEESSEGQATLVGMINSVRYHTTKNDKQMVFATLEDMEGTTDLVIFTEALEKYANVIAEGNIVWVKGVAGNGQGERENISVRVEELLTLDEARRKFAKSFHINISSELVEQSILKSLKDACLNSKGECSLFLHLKTPQCSEVVVQANPDCKVLPTDELILKIERIIGENCVWLSNS